ncbi:MAG: hypothetical protein LBI13_06820 [Streptococcaceae bacterium]|jgi:bacteriocin-like protein|nr:hypothetical protein [Streptococcaceae bacterium]
MTDEELQEINGGVAGTINKYGVFVTTLQINNALRQAQLGNYGPFNSLGL